MADEPTGNLDVETGISILELIVEMTEEAGKSLLMVTHSPEAMSFASHVFTVENRQVISRKREDSDTPCHTQTAFQMGFF